MACDCPAMQLANSGCDCDDGQAELRAERRGENLACSKKWMDPANFKAGTMVVVRPEIDLKRARLENLCHLTTSWDTLSTPGEKWEMCEGPEELSFPKEAIMAAMAGCDVGDLLEIQLKTTQNGYIWVPMQFFVPVE